MTEREESQTKFENLDGAEAGQVDAKADPELVEAPAGGPPELPPGEAIGDFPTDDAASVENSEGPPAIIESSVPIAIESSPGQRSPIELGLAEADGGFRPRQPLVPVQIPNRLSAGVQLPEAGLTVIPVSSAGPSLAGEGAVDGSVVIYPNTTTDSDTVVKPTTFGVAVDTLLRSKRSPQQLSYRLAMPSGATLRASKGQPGGLEVLEQNVAVGLVPPPSAHDAAGQAVPLSMSVSGNVITLAVASDAREYEYPIAVDPEFNTGTDTTLGKRTWSFSESGGGWAYSEVECCGHEMSLYHDTSNHAGEWGQLYYQTTGDSKI